jgi:hypothetical protein
LTKYLTKKTPKGRKVDFGLQFQKFSPWSTCSFDFRPMVRQKASWWKGVVEETAHFMSARKQREKEPGTRYTVPGHASNLLTPTKPHS